MELLLAHGTVKPKLRDIYSNQIPEEKYDFFIDKITDKEVKYLPGGLTAISLHSCSGISKEGFRRLSTKIED